MAGRSGWIARPGSFKFHPSEDSSRSPVPVAVLRSFLLIFFCSFTRAEMSRKIIFYFSRKKSAKNFAANNICYTFALSNDDDRPGGPRNKLNIILWYLDS